MNIGLGTAAIGRPHYINIRKDGNPSDQPFSLNTFKEKGKLLLSDAYNQGIRHFDTAPGYGIAETILLEWLEESGNKDISISTKWGYTYVANFDPKATKHEIKEHSLAKLNEQWEQSSAFLPYLNFYQIHSATFDSGVLINEAVLLRLYELKKQHNIKIGLSSTGPHQNEVILAAMDIHIDNEALFDGFQVTYNIFEQRLHQLKDALQGKYLIIKEALANGRVFRNDQYSNYQSAYNLLEKLSKKYQVGLDAIALRFVEDSLQPSMILSGSSESNQLDNNRKALNFELSAHDIDLLKGLMVKPEEYWTERKHLDWN